MNGLFFPIPPAMPDQRGGFVTCQPPVTWLTFRRQRYSNNATMKSLIGVMVDRGPKRFQVAPRAAFVAAMPDVLAAFVRVDGGQHLAAPEIVEAADTRVQVVEFVAGLARIGEVDRQHVGAVDLLDVAPAAF